MIPLNFNPPSTILHNPTVQKAIDDLIQKYHLASNELTERQIAHTILQMLACGEFTRYLVINSDKQTVVYLPYKREQELLSEIEELKLKLSELTTKSNLS